MSTVTFDSRTSEASRDTASHPLSSHSSLVCYTSIQEICSRLMKYSKNAHDGEYRAQTRVKQVIACCMRQLERFAGAPRPGVYEDGEPADSSSCFELRRQRSNTLPLEPSARRTRKDRPAPFISQCSSSTSYQFYMDEEIHPFITTPKCIEEGSSPKYTLFPTSSPQ